MSIKEMKIAVIDVETTGLSPENDRIVELAIALFDRGELTRSFAWLIDPGIPIPEEASKVHGITDAAIRAANAPAFDQVVDVIEETLGDYLPCAYNAPFDRAFVHASMRRAGFIAAPGCVALHESHGWIDPLVWVREFQKYEKGKRLADACARMGIRLDNAHRAGADAEAAGRVLMAYASRMPSTYEEILDMQTRLGKEHDEQYRAWRERNAERAQ